MPSTPVIDARYRFKGAVPLPADLDTDERFNWISARHNEAPSTTLMSEFLRNRAEWKERLKQTGKKAQGPEGAESALTVAQPRGWRFPGNANGTMPRDVAVAPIPPTGPTSLVPTEPPIGPKPKPPESRGEFGAPTYQPNHTTPKTGSAKVRKPTRYRSLTRAIASKVPALKAPSGRVGLAFYLLALLLLLVILLVKVRTSAGPMTRWQIAGQVLSGKAAIS